MKSHVESCLIPKLGLYSIDQITQMPFSEQTTYLGGIKMPNQGLELQFVLTWFVKE